VISRPTSSLGASAFHRPPSHVLIAVALPLWLAAAGLVTAVEQPSGEPAVKLAIDAEKPLVEVEQGNGTVTVGRLEHIDATEVRLAASPAGDAVTVPVERVRAVRRLAVVAGAPPKLVLTLVDGSTLSATDFIWDGKLPAVLVRPEGRIELPAARVRSIAWPTAGGGGDVSMRWQGTIPEGTESDLIVVGNEESHEFVECAIAAVSADTVTVVLDEETIPVKRSKVIGMQWLQANGAHTDANAPGRIVVAVDGGSVRARRVEWTPDALVIDGEIRLPATLLAAIDYASGRMVGLATLPAEKVDVEPWFGGLSRDAGLASFFAPRPVPARASGADGGQEGSGVPAAAAVPAAGAGVLGMIMRPRTVAVWRLPPDSRRFRATVAAAAGTQSSDGAIVSVSVDDQEVFRRQVDASAGDSPAGIPIDIDLTAKRRLTVVVERGGGIGGAVLFSEPVIER